MSLSIARALAAAAMLGVAARAHGQTPQNPAEAAGHILRNENNPTRPILFSIRPEFYNPSEDVKQAALIFRYDQAALRARRFLPGKRGIVVRFEVPISATDVANTTTAVGLGDAYGQLLLLPHVTPTGGFVIGLGVVLPTGTDKLLGRGKWILAPATGPIWFFGGRGLFFVKLQDFVSIAGDASRPELNYLLVTPTFVQLFKQQWWVLADFESKTDWLNHSRTGMKSGVQLGRNVSRGFGVWMKPELWWGPNEDGQWNLKFGIVWFR
jgi:hypothetical protein